MIILTSPSDVAFSVNGFSVYYYGICIGLAVLLGFLLSYFVAKKYYKEIDAEILYDLVAIIVFGGIVFARLYYCALNFDYYVSHVSEIFNIRQGGLAIHGGLIGGFLSGVIYAYFKKYPILKLADIVAYGLILAQAVGRWGNFFNSEAYGLPAKNFIAVFIPEANRVAGYEFYKYFHPTFLYESVLNILCLFVLFFIIRNIKGRFDGLIFASYLIFYSIIRFFIEALRLDCIVNVGSFHFPQIASIVTIVIALIIMLIGKFQQNKEKSI